MAFNQKKYIAKYNKETYKMFPFRVRNDNSPVINKLNEVRNKNKYITELIERDINPSVLTIKQIKEAIMPIMRRHGIDDVYLFGSYARGEANNNSDVDIYCGRGDVNTLWKLSSFKDELINALKKDVDIVTIGAQMPDYFEEQLRKDMIKLC